MSPWRDKRGIEQTRKDRATKPTMEGWDEQLLNYLFPTMQWTTDILVFHNEGLKVRVLPLKGWNNFRHFLDPGWKFGGWQNKIYWRHVSNALSHCFLLRQLLVHRVILLVAFPHNLKNQYWLSNFKANIIFHIFPERFCQKGGLLQIIQLSGGKVSTEKKSFDVNLCLCQHLVTALVKVEPDLKEAQKLRPT